MWFFLAVMAMASSDPQAACDAGDMQACVDLGSAYLQGEGKPRDPFRAVQLFRKACSGKNAHGCMYLAEAYRKGEGAGADANKALDYYTQACDLGDGLACRSVGDLYVMGTVGRADGRTAGLWYRMACDLMDGPSCTAAALWLERGDVVEADPKGAAILFEQGCTLGDVRGCTQLGIRYAKGAGGLSRDQAKAGAWYARACPMADDFDPEGCRELGWMQIKGKGVPENPTEGHERLERACFKNDHEGCRYLADVELDRDHLAEALVAAQRGCDLGDTPSCRRLDKVKFKMLQ